KKDFGNYLRMMDETGNLVISKMKQGRSLEEIEAEGLQPEWAAWAWANVSPAGLIASIWRSASAAGLGAARKDQSTSQGAGLEIQVTRLADSIYLLQGSRDSEALAGGPNGEWLADLF